MANLIHKGIVQLNSNFKYQFSNEEILYQRPDESLVQTIEHLRPTQHQVQYATLGETVENYYNYAAKRNYQKYVDSEDDNNSEEEIDELDSDNSDSEEEENPYENGRWT